MFQGSYIHIPHDHIAYRYEILKVIGKGSFGQVLKVYDHKTHQHVALKMVRNEKRFHRQAQEEIRILEHLRKQDKDNSCNIIHMLDNFTFRYYFRHKILKMTLTWLRILLFQESHMYNVWAFINKPLRVNQEEQVPRVLSSVGPQICPQFTSMLGHIVQKQNHPLWYEARECSTKTTGKIRN